MQEERLVELGPERSLRAVTVGDGPDVVLLHGAVTTAHDWLTGAIDELAALGLRVTALDRPGHGLSRRPRFEGSPREQARQIREGLDALGIGRAGFVGHSYGGLVALAHAELFPDASDYLVLVAPLAFPEWRTLEHSLFAPRAAPVAGPIFAKLAQASFDRPLLEMVQRLMFSPQPVDPGWKAAFPYAQVLRSEAMVREGEDAAAILPGAPTGLIDLAAVRAPAFILTGTADKIVEDERQAKLLARLLPDARLLELDGVGHMLHLVRPEEVRKAVAEMAARAAAPA